ncbi:hypothetical protein ACG02S_17560 [Roseateles sp. DC23W]|uniref:Uncharacterized protein n=1 Tax=Pelomonas dachongensis TaxID=3299029 RepID=A0ABW7ESV7_9BURK
MTTLLVKFWMLRFVQSFLGAGAALALFEWPQQRGAGFDGVSVVAWAALTALLTASVSAWWAYKRQCRVVFKQPS